MKDNYKTVVVHGDGIGPEVAGAALAVLRAGVQAGTLEFEEFPAGATHFLEDSLPPFVTQLSSDGLQDGIPGAR